MMNRSEDFAETADAFIRHLESVGYAKKTLIDYRYLIKPFVAFILQNDITRFSNVTPDTILAYQEYVHHEHKSKYTGKSVSQYHQRNLLVVLKVLFKYLVRSGKTLNDPTTLMDLPRITRRLPRNILTKREMRRLLKTCNLRSPRGYRDRVIFEILYATGIRRDELRNLQLFDVDTRKRELIVRQGKGGKDRIIPIAKKACVVIERYVEKHRHKLLDPTKADHGYILINDWGRKLGKDFSTKLLRRYVKEARIKKNITTHSFRHTFATHLLRNKASIRAIQELLGHTSIQSTQIYTRVEIGDLRRVIDKSHPREKMD